MFYHSTTASKNGSTRSFDFSAAVTAVLHIVQLGETKLGTGVDYGLLVDPANTFPGADIEGVLGHAVTRAFAVESAVGLLLPLSFPARPPGLRSAGCPPEGPCLFGARSMIS